MLGRLEDCAWRAAACGARSRNWRLWFTLVISPASVIAILAGAIPNNEESNSKMFEQQVETSSRGAFEGFTRRSKAL